MFAVVEDDALPAAGAGLEVAAVRAIEGVVELTGRVTAPGAGPVGARVPALVCAPAAVDAPISLAARSLAALAASPTRDPESETPLSVAPVAAREGEPVVGADSVLAVGALGAAPPTPGMPNPAGEVGLAPATGVWPAAADDGAEEAVESEVGADGEADAEAVVGAEAEVDAEPE